MNRAIVSINRTSQYLFMPIAMLPNRRDSVTSKLKNFALGIGMVLFFYNIAFGDTPAYFRHYSLENGLSNNCITSILQDQKGFLWIGTKDGLNRFDGYTFKIFKKDRNRPGSIGSNYVHVLHEDKEGILWIGTEHGLYQYTPATETFCLIDATANRYVDELKEDHNGNLWLLSSSVLCRYNKRTQQMEYPKNWEPLRIANIDNDNNGNIWAGTIDGNLIHFAASGTSYEVFDLFSHSQPAGTKWVESTYVTRDGYIVLGMSQTSFKLFDPKLRDYTDIVLPTTERNLYIRTVQQAGNNELWLGTEFGVFIYNRESASTRHFKKDYNDPYAISDNAVYALYEDREGGMWAGTFFGGLNYLPKQYKPFTKYYPRRGLNAIVGNVVREIKKDGSGNLWIGTEDAGVNRLDTKTGRFTHYDSRTAGLAFDNIHGLLISDNELWIGTLLHGLDVMDIRSGKIIKHYEVEKNSGFTHDFIYGIYQLPRKEIMITTPHGAFTLNKQLGKFEWFKGLPQWIWYTSVLVDHSGVIWAGSFGEGVHYYNPATGERRAFKHDNNNNNSLSNNRVNGIFEDSSHRLWFTTDEGLCRFEKATGNFTRFGTGQGFPSNFMFSILEDRRHRLWISTTGGLTCFDPARGKLQVYTAKNGLLSDQFNYSSAFLDTDGRMYFGSTKGLISFYPDNFTGNEKVSPVSLTALLVNQEEVSPAAGALLKTSIESTTELVLPHDHSTFSIDFASLNFTQSDILNYAYQLSGLSPTWIYLKNSRRADFVGLAPGTYLFSVKALRTDGAESKPTQLKITVLPPWWLSVPAYITYTLLILTSILMLVRLGYNRIKEKNNRKIELLKIASEKDILKMELAKEKELLQDKIDFFTNVAHEIKTPLTLIKIPLTKVLKKTDHMPDVQNNLNTMHRNTNRLLELTNQLLDFRQTEINKFKISLKLVNISELVSETVQGFSELAEEKDLELLCYLPEEIFYAHVDVDALSKILNNLLSNAVKYASRLISIHLVPYRDSPETFTIEFNNDGHLIPPGFKEKIFEPFFRLQEAETESGSGIGLALSRSLAHLHGGSLTLQSSADNINSFLLTLPVHVSAASVDQQIHSKV